LKLDQEKIRSTNNSQSLLFEKNGVPTLSLTDPQPNDQLMNLRIEVEELRERVSLVEHERDSLLAHVALMNSYLDSFANAHKLLQLF